MGFGPQHETVSDGAGGTMVQANYATGKGQSFKRWYNCQICGFSYPEDEVILDGGLAYCLKFDHYLDIDKLSAGELKFRGMG